MVSGRMARYRATPPQLGPAMQVEQDTASRLGAPAEPWFAVWLTKYRVVRDHGSLAASYADIEPLRIRPITWRVPGILNSAIPITKGQSHA